MDGLGAAPDSSGVPAGDAEVAQLEHLSSRSAAQMGAENFPVAMRLLPRVPREQLALVYGFARFVDDVGDEAGGDRGKLLDLVEDDLHALWTATATLTPVKALRPVMAAGTVPEEPFQDLVEANRVDQRTSRYETFEDLLDYCRLSAAPVGRIVLHIAGAASAPNIADSDSVCAALQVLEHCQDVGEDARMGRVYLPDVDLRAAGVTAEDLLAPSTSRPLQGVVEVQVARAQFLLRPGRNLVRRLSGWSRIAVAGYVAGGLATVHALRHAECDVLTNHIGPTKARTVGYAVRLMAGR